MRSHSFRQPSPTALVTSHLYGCTRYVALTQVVSRGHITLPFYAVIYPDTMASLEATVSSSVNWDNNGDYTALADLRNGAGPQQAYSQCWGSSSFTQRETKALRAKLAVPTDRAKRGTQATNSHLEVPATTVYSVSVATEGGQIRGVA